MLEDHWYIACRSRSLNKKPVSIKLFGKSVVLFRDQQAHPVAIMDRCQHRNVPLSCGTVENGEISCPYHGWRYDASGKLVDIPYAINNELVKNTGVNAYSCCEQDGYIWVSTGKPDSGKNQGTFPHLGKKGWKSFHMDTLFEGTVEACLENFLDCPHALSVHRFWFRSPASKVVQATIRSLDDGAVVEYFSEPRGKSAVWLLLSSASEQMTHTDRFIAPATSRVEYKFSDKREYVITSSCTPVDDHTTRVFTVISFRFGYLGWLIRPFFHLLSRLIIKQDVQILRLQQANIKQFGKTKFVAVDEDVLFKPILAWRSALQKGESPPVSGHEVQVELRF